MTGATGLARFEQEGPVAILSINNPPLNLLSQPVKMAVLEFVGQISRDRTIRAVILAGAGEKGFSAGADLHEWQDRIRNRTAADDSRRGQQLAQHIRAIPQPVIAAINGYCFGGGLELALACDFRVAGRSCRLGTPEVNRGAFPGTAGSQLLPRLIGPSKAKQMMMFGEHISAPEAYGLGLIDYLVDDGEVLAHAHVLARTLSTKPAMAVASIKRLVNEGLETSLERGFALETALFERIYETADVQEGLLAFFEKREPNFHHQ